MAKKIELKNSDLELDIAGHVFTLNTGDPELLEKVSNFSEEAQKKAEDIGENKDYIKALKETIQFCLDTIDKILGESASKKIFEGKKVNLFDALNIINSINIEVKADMDNKFKAYSPNRAQRRSNKNKKK
ncbi:DUF6673 family protein [Senegalia massiliensis]|uniref:DUF6673 domain-containing protein n=1 Tax=Senegalia massiliensis TaxID=1720316 RepID=A0A845R0V3_9CLOT|nr:DUF6673 family protein [Senegalia massiliensis]NBI08060.1 hypothetical protein [Senegalia massiliensis]